MKKRPNIDRHTHTNTHDLSSYLFGWVVRCCGSCGTFPPRQPSLPQCSSASSWGFHPPGPRPCPIGCHQSSPGCTYPRQCWCSWSDWCHPPHPFACFSFWTQSRCQWTAGTIRREGKKGMERKGERRRRGKKRWARDPREIRISRKVKVLDGIESVCSLM